MNPIEQYKQQKLGYLLTTESFITKVRLFAQIRSE